MNRITFTQRVAALFTAHPGEWITSYDLARIGGVCGWRTRVSQCRTRLNMTIENQQRARPDGSILSTYRYIPEE